MEISIDDLKKRYEALDTSELLALKQNGGLTDTAFSLLEEKLSKRNLPDEQQQLEKQELEKEAEDIDKQEKNKLRKGNSICH